MVEEMNKRKNINNAIILILMFISISFFMCGCGHASEKISKISFVKNYNGVFNKEINTLYAYKINYVNFIDGNGDVINGNVKVKEKYLVTTKLEKDYLSTIYMADGVEEEDGVYYLNGVRIADSRLYVKKKPIKTFLIKMKFISDDMCDINFYNISSFIRNAVFVDDFKEIKKEHICINATDIECIYYENKK